MSDAMNLPPLPEPFDSWKIEDGVRAVFTADQMRAYGKACAAAERERAALVCESMGALDALTDEDEASAAMVRVADRQAALCALAIRNA